MDFVCFSIFGLIKIFRCRYYVWRFICIFGEIIFALVASYKSKFFCLLFFLIKTRAL